MTSQINGINHLSARLGFWSAFFGALTFLIFTVCFVCIVALQPLFTWTTLADYVTYTQTHGSLLPDLARLMMLCFSASYIVLLNAIYAYAGAEQKILVRISLCFGLTFAMLTGAHYFVQISTVRLALAAGTFAGLEQIVQANPYSAFSAINMLGWTFGLGLSSLFMAPVFAAHSVSTHPSTRSGVAKVIRAAFFLNGIFCVLGGVGYVSKSIVLVFLTINFGMGGAVMVLTIALCLFFRQIARAEPLASMSFG